MDVYNDSESSGDNNPGHDEDMEASYLKRNIDLGETVQT